MQVVHRRQEVLTRGPRVQVGVQPIRTTGGKWEPAPLCLRGKRKGVRRVTANPRTPPPPLCVRLTVTHPHYAAAERPCSRGPPASAVRSWSARTEMVRWNVVLRVRWCSRPLLWYTFTSYRPHASVTVSSTATTRRRGHLQAPASNEIAAVFVSNVRGRPSFDHNWASSESR